jgi:hypothetical protein
VLQSSLRPWILSLDLSIGDLGLDLRDDHVRPYHWWDVTLS